MMMNYTAIRELLLQLRPQVRTMLVCFGELAQQPAHVGLRSTWAMHQQRSASSAYEEDTGVDGT